MYGSWRVARGKGRTIRGAPIQSSAPFRASRKTGFMTASSAQAGPASRRRQRVADRGRRADRGHGAGRRRHAAHRIRIVDRRVEAGHRHAAAAQRGAVGAGVRGLQGDPAIPRTQRRHEPCGVQDHLLVGMEPPPARARDRRGLSAAVPVLPVARRVERRAETAALDDLRAWRAAGRGRLVDGRVGTYATDRSLPVSAGDASGAGPGHFCLDHMDLAANERASAADCLQPSEDLRGGFAGPDLRPALFRRAGRGPAGGAGCTTPGPRSTAP